MQIDITKSTQENFYALVKQTLSHLDITKDNTVLTLPETPLEINQKRVIPNQDPKYYNTQVLINNKTGQSVLSKPIVILYNRLDITTRAKLKIGDSLKIIDNKVNDITEDVAIKKVLDALVIIKDAFTITTDRQTNMISVTLEAKTDASNFCYMGRVVITVEPK